MPVINPDHLLEQAERLVNPTGPGAPRQADLRRAISAAYYALFHTLLAETADQIAGKSSRSTGLYALVYRSVEHRTLRELCEVVTKSTPPKKYLRFVPVGGFGGDLIAVATTLLELQEKRHSADYDPLYRARTSDAVLAIATARSAIGRFGRADPGFRHAFVLLLAFPPK